MGKEAGPWLVLEAEVTGVETNYSDPTNILRLVDASYQLLFDDVIAGTVTVWVTNKPNPDLADDDDWTQLSLAVPITQPTGAAAYKEFVDLAGLPASLARLKFVSTAGAAGKYARAYVVAKGGA